MNASEAHTHMDEMARERLDGAEIEADFATALENWPDADEAQRAELRAWFDALRAELLGPLADVDDEIDAGNLAGLYLFRLRSTWMTLNMQANYRMARGEFDPALTARAGLASVLIGVVETLLPNRDCEHATASLNRFSLAGGEPEVGVPRAAIERLFTAMEDSFATRHQLEGRVESARAELRARQRREAEDAVERAFDDLQRRVSEVQRAGRVLQQGVTDLRYRRVAFLGERWQRALESLGVSTRRACALGLHLDEGLVDVTMADAISDVVVGLFRARLEREGEAGEETRFEARSRYRGNRQLIEIRESGSGEAGGEPEDGRLAELRGKPRFRALDRGLAELESAGCTLRGRREEGGDWCWTIEMPSTLRMVQVLIVEVAGLRYAWPLSATAELLAASRVRRQTSRGQEVIDLRGRVLPVVSLAERLHPGEAAAGGAESALIVADMPGRAAAFGVDRVLRQLTALLLPLGELVGENPFFSGAVVLDEGPPALLLCPEQIAG